MMRTEVIIILMTGVIALGTVASAQDMDSSGDFEVISETENWTDASVSSDRCVNGLLGHPIPARTLQIVIMHRARKTFTKDPCDTYLGLDAGGLKIGLGLRWGIKDDVDFGFLRVNGTAEIFDTYEFDARYALLSQERSFMDLAIRPGVTWFKQPDMGDASGFFGQILGSKDISEHVILGGGFLYHSDSSGDRKSQADDDASYALLGILELRLASRLAWDGELIANIGGYGEDNASISSSLKLFTYGHTFSVVVTNTQYMTADGVVTNAWRGWDDLIIGFNITRTIGL